MPTYKHPCPQCNSFIERTVELCPTCGFVDPFGPDAARRAVRIPATNSASPAAAAAPVAGAACRGCGAELAPGARFCTACGTLVGQ